MGQVPKKIIYAASGTKLKFNIDGKDIELDENTIDAMAAEEGNRLVQAGELHQEDLPTWMQTYSTFKDQAKTGKYKLDTAGPGALASMKYEGVTSQSGLGFDEHGEAAKRTGAGRWLARQGIQSSIKPKEANMMSRLNNVLGARIGGLGLGETKKIEDAAEALKKKTETEAEAAKKAELDKWKTHEDLGTFANKRYGGTTDNMKFIMSRPVEEKTALLKEHFEKIMASKSKYEDTKDFDVSFLEKYKNKATGGYDYSPAFFQDFYGRLYGNRGYDQVNALLGITPEGTDTTGTKTPEETEAQRVDTATKRAQLEANPSVKKTGENEYYIPSSKVAASIGSPNKMGTIISFGPKGEVTHRFTTIKPGESNLNPTTVTSGIQPLLDVIAKGAMKAQPLPIPGPRTTYKEQQIGEGGASYIQSEQNPDDARYLGEGGVIMLQSGGVAKEVSSNEALDYAINYKGETTPETQNTLGTGATTSGNIVADSPYKSTAQKVVSSVAGKSLPSSGKLKDLADFGELTDSDKLDAAALAMDIGGLATGILGGAVGGSLVSSGLGLTSTITSAVAEAKRNGLHLDDWAGIALSAGLDIASVIPYVGVGAQSAKIVKNIPRIARLLALVGTSEAAVGGYQLATSLMNGEKKFEDLTTDDLKMIVSGLRIAAQGKNVRQLGKTVGVKSPTEIQGKVRTSNTGQVVPATMVKNAKLEWVPKDSQFAGDQVLQEGSLFGFGKSRVIGSNKGSVVRTDTETASPITENGVVKNIIARMRDQRGVNVRNAARESKFVSRLPEENIAVSNKNAPPPVAPKNVVPPSSPNKNVPTGKNAPPPKPPAPPAPPKPVPSDPNKKAPRKKAAPKAPAQPAQPTTPVAPPKKPAAAVNPAEAFQKAARKHTGTSPRRTQSNRLGGILFAQSGTQFNRPMPITTVKGGFIDPKYNLKTSTVTSQLMPGAIQENRAENARYLVNTAMPLATQVGRPQSSKIAYTPSTATRVDSTDSDRLNMERITRMIGAGGYQPPMEKRLTPTPVKSTIAAPEVINHLMFSGNNVAQTGAEGKLTPREIVESGLRKELPEFGRMLGSNAATRKIDTRIQAPMVTAPNISAAPVQGDMLAEAAAQKQAADLMNTTPLTSDSTKNEMYTLGRAKAAGNAIEMGRRESAVAQQQSQANAAQVEAQNVAARAEASNANTQQLSQSIQGQRLAENAKQSQIDSNMDTWLASRNLKKEIEGDRKNQIMQQFKLKTFQRNLEANPKFTDLPNKLYMARTNNRMTPELLQLEKEYQDQMDMGMQQIMMAKEGGSVKAQNKFDMDNYKERQKSNKETASIYNRWNEKTGDKADKRAFQASHDIMSFINKILK